VYPKAFNCVARARRLKPTYTTNEWRESPLVNSNEQDERLGEHSRARSLRRLGWFCQPRFTTVAVFLCLPELAPKLFGCILPLGRDLGEAERTKRLAHDDN